MKLTILFLVLFSFYSCKNHSYICGGVPEILEGHGLPQGKVNQLQLILYKLNYSDTNNCYIRGFVSEYGDSTKDLMPFVNIKIISNKNDTSYAQTDFDGRFILLVNQGTSRLVVDFMEKQMDTTINFPSNHVIDLYITNREDSNNFHVSKMTKSNYTISDLFELNK